MEQLLSSSKTYFRAFLAKKYTGRRYDFSNRVFRYKDKFNKFTEEYPVVLSTTHAILKSKHKNYIFDYMIVDEASQVELVPGIMALSGAKNSVIV